MSFPIQPENGNLIVKEFKKKDLHKMGSIFVGTMADLDFGEIVAVDIATKFKEGQIVGYPAKVGQGIYAKAEIFLLIKQDNVVGTWDKEEWNKVYSANE